MNESRFAIRVGLFVLIGLALLGALLVSFSKGMPIFTPSFRIDLRAGSVGGLKKNANVLLSGVPVGKVAGFDVSPDGRGVLIHLQIEEQYHSRIHADARFAIEQLGLLGDQYVEITPLENKLSPVQVGQVVQAEEPLSLQQTARSAKDLIHLASQTLTTFNEVMGRIDRTILSDRALTNVAGALDNFHTISERGAILVNTIEALVQTNRPAISGTVSNLVQFSEDMDKLSSEMSQIVATNRVELAKAVKSLQTTSKAMEQIVTEVQAGQGLAGLVLKDPETRERFSNMASNLQVFSRNLNEHGLLHNMFFKPNPPKPPKEGKK